MVGEWRVDDSDETQRCAKMEGSVWKSLRRRVKGREDKVKGRGRSYRETGQLSL